MYEKITASTFALLLLVLLSSSGEAALPQGLSPCPKSGPNVATCIKDIMDSIRPNLASGTFGNLKTLPTEPVVINHLDMVSPEVNVTIKNILATGATGYTVEKVKPQLENLSVEMILSYPKWDFKGRYDLNVKAGPIEIHGRGGINGTFTRPHFKIRARFRTEEVDGVTYVRFQRFQIRIKIEGGQLYLDNLFDGDEVLGDFGNQFINMRTADIIQHLEPEVERELTETYSKILQTLFQDVKYSDMFA